MKKLILVTAVILAALTLTACSKNEPAKPAAETPQPAAPATAAAEPTQIPAAVPGGTSGTVIETMNSGGYTYVYVDNGTDKVWAAAPEFSVAVGDEVMVPEGMAMHNYHSQTLNRDFDVVYFVEAVLNASSPAMAAPAKGSGMMGGSSMMGANPADMKIPEGHPSISGAKAPEEVDLTAIQKADGGMTIGEIYTGKADLADKTVTLRAKVVKFSPQIMGTNWLHLQDGSGNLEAGTHDLTVTSDVNVSVGDTVVVSGALTLDKDFGYGYKYNLIIESATVTVE
ncbi:MAG: DNA-binding protein [Desulfuromusa sp.]|nr:DNA-binding protein [Desulfuromusa sp.]